MSFSHSALCTELALPSTALPEGYAHSVVAVTETTMKDVQAFLQSGDPEARHGFVLQALHQTDGRGAKGRSWESGAGNLLFSMIVDMHHLHHREVALIMAMALMEALRESVPDHAPSVTFKMANDAFLNRGKLSGILTHRDWCHGNLCNIGVGVNLATPPTLAQDNPYRAACLREFGWDARRPSSDFLKVLLAHFEPAFQATLEERHHPWKMLGAQGAAERQLTIVDDAGSGQIITGAYIDFVEHDDREWLRVQIGDHTGFTLAGASTTRILLQDGGWTGGSLRL